MTNKPKKSDCCGAEIKLYGFAEDTVCTKCGKFCEEIVNEQVKCKYCYDKGFYTVADEGEIKKYPCKRCQPQKEVKEEKCRKSECNTFMSLGSPDFCPAHNIYNQLRCIQNKEYVIDNWKELWPHYKDKMQEFIQDLVISVREDQKRIDAKIVQTAINNSGDNINSGGCEGYYIGILVDIKQEIFNQSNDV